MNLEYQGAAIGVLPEVAVCEGGGRRASRTGSMAVVWEDVSTEEGTELVGLLGYHEDFKVGEAGEGGSPVCKT